MKLLLKEVDCLRNDSLSVKMREEPCFDQSWHYHPQFELIYISKSYGVRFVGDSVENFKSGDLVLVGPNLPHLWRNNDDYKQGAMVNTVVINFDRNFIGQNTFDKPEFMEINHLLNQSRFGIHFSKISCQLRDELLALSKLSIADQAIKLLMILNRLSVSRHMRTLSTTDMRQEYNSETRRLDYVLKFISDNYVSDISLNDVAEVACMTANSFCRYFKKSTSKSFTQFLNEVRIKNASRLLVQDEISVSEICYKVGFNSIANFNKKFKQITGQTPTQYRCAV
ncbi:AraC family transcriptional regulator [Reichenbachiella versicolor]|uniref:AraC family transcriptional regulator n=1 Tax=Reichenbachiella versicolor TaxID=1821036 RepID=UPI000D6E91C5|nr:AraC family transcriptional regulator [Reichenbachiella versicolor]